MNFSQYIRILTASPCFLSSLRSSRSSSCKFPSNYPGAELLSCWQQDREQEDPGICKAGALRSLLRHVRMISVGLQDSLPPITLIAGLDEMSPALCRRHRIPEPSSLDLRDHRFRALSHLIQCTITYCMAFTTTSITCLPRMPPGLVCVGEQRDVLSTPGAAIPDPPVPSPHPVSFSRSRSRSPRPRSRVVRAPPGAPSGVNRSSVAVVAGGR